MHCPMSIATGAKVNVCAGAKIRFRPSDVPIRINRRDLRSYTKIQNPIDVHHLLSCPHSRYNPRAFSIMGLERSDTLDIFLSHSSLIKLGPHFASPFRSAAPPFMTLFVFASAPSTPFWLFLMKHFPALLTRHCHITLDLI